MVYFFIDWQGKDKQQQQQIKSLETEKVSLGAPWAD